MSNIGRREFEDFRTRVSNRFSSCSCMHRESRSLCTFCVVPGPRRIIFTSSLGYGPHAIFALSSKHSPVSLFHLENPHPKCNICGPVTRTLRPPPPEKLKFAVTGFGPASPSPSLNPKFAHLGRVPDSFLLKSEKHGFETSAILLSSLYQDLGKFQIPLQRGLKFDFLPSKYCIKYHGNPKSHSLSSSFLSRGWPGGLSARLSLDLCLQKILIYLISFFLVFPSVVSGLEV